MSWIKFGMMKLMIEHMTLCQHELYIIYMIFLATNIYLNGQQIVAILMLIPFCITIKYLIWYNFCCVLYCIIFFKQENNTI